MFPLIYMSYIFFVSLFLSPVLQMRGWPPSIHGTYFKELMEQQQRHSSMLSRVEFLRRVRLGPTWTWTWQGGGMRGQRKRRWNHSPTPNVILTCVLFVKDVTRLCSLDTSHEKVASLAHMRRR